MKKKEKKKLRNIYNSVMLFIYFKDNLSKKYSSFVKSSIKGVWFIEYFEVM